MAAVSINITLEDEKKETSVAAVHLPASTTVAQAQDHAEYVADLIDDMTGCRIINVGLSYDVPYDSDASLKLVAAAGSDVQEGARFGFRTAGGYSSKIRIPGFLETLMISATLEVDQTDTIIQDFVGYMLAGNDATPTLVGDPTDYRGDDLVSLAYAVDAFQKSRKRR